MTCHVDDWAHCDTSRWTAEQFMCELRRMEKAREDWVGAYGNLLSSLSIGAKTEIMEAVNRERRNGELTLFQKTVLRTMKIASTP